MFLNRPPPNQGCCGSVGFPFTSHAISVRGASSSPRLWAPRWQHGTTPQGSAAPAASGRSVAWFPWCTWPWRLANQRHAATLAFHCATCNACRRALCHRADCKKPMQRMMPQARAIMEEADDSRLLSDVLGGHGGKRVRGQASNSKHETWREPRLHRGPARA